MGIEWVEKPSGALVDGSLGAASPRNGLVCWGPRDGVSAASLPIATPK